MPIDNNTIIITTYLVGQSLVFTQCDKFVSIAGLLVASLVKRLLNWSFTFHALWSLKHYIPYVDGSDKLDYYTHSLEFKVRKSQAMAMPSL